MAGRPEQDDSRKRKRSVLRRTDWNENMCITYERTPSQALKESQAITAQAHSHCILALALQNIKTSPVYDVFRRAYLPYTQQRSLAYVYPFLDPTQPQLKPVPSTLVDLQQMYKDKLHPQLEAYCRQASNRTADAVSPESYSLVWMRLTRDTPYEAQLGEMIHSAPGNALNALVPKNPHERLRQLRQQWNDMNIDSSRMQKHKLQEIQRGLHALVTWGKGFPATRNGNHKLSGLHSATPYYLHVAQENAEDTGMAGNSNQAGELTVTLEVPVISVPDRAYISKNPFTGRIIPNDEQQTWACAYVRELKRSAVRFPPPHAEIEAKLSQIQL